MRDVFKAAASPRGAGIAATPGMDGGQPARAPGASVSVTKHGDGELGSRSLVMPANEECSLASGPRAVMGRRGD